jgi:hypothetical protein
MEDTWTKALLILLPVLVGAGIGIFPTLLLERVRTAAALRTRWDDKLQTVGAEFAACTRRLIDIAEDPAADTRALDDEHRQLQIRMAEIRILGGLAVQTSARRVVTNAYALQVAAGTGDTADPRRRTIDSLFEFYRAVRLQLKVPEAEIMAPMNPPALETDKS